MAMSADKPSDGVDGEGRAGRGGSQTSNGSETLPREGSYVTDHRKVAERLNERVIATGRGGTTFFSCPQLQRPEPFDRKVAWDVYRAHFELLAEMNGSNDTKKAAHLAVSLRGAAATVLTNIPVEQRQNYLSLTTALEMRFGTAHQKELNCMRLKTCNRRRDERSRGRRGAVGSSGLSGCHPAYG